MCGHYWKKLFEYASTYLSAFEQKCCYSNFCSGNRMYSIDKTLFSRVTGTEFYSEVGLKFRQLAIKSLKSVLDEAQYSNGSDSLELIHRVKGITLACGVPSAAHVCSKLEEYNEVMNVAKTQEELIHLIMSVINLYDSE